MGCCCHCKCHQTCNAEETEKSDTSVTSYYVIKEGDKYVCNKHTGSQPMTDSYSYLTTKQALASRFERRPDVFNPNQRVVIVRRLPW